MSINKISAMAIAGLLALGVVATVAQNAFVPPATPQQAVDMRKSLMIEDGRLIRTLNGLSGAEAAAALNVILNNYTHIPALFPEGSNLSDSEALPAIWQNWDTFTAIVETGKAAATDAIAAAEAGDATAYATALRALGGTCGQCHQQFRE